MPQMSDDATELDLRRSAARIEALEAALREVRPHPPRTRDYPDPTPEMLDGDPLFEAIWQAIKGWDISRHNDGLYSGPTGNDVRHIYDAVRPAAARIEALEAALRYYADPNNYSGYGMYELARAALAPEQDK
jgi:hypothetical protein